MFLLIVFVPYVSFVVMIALPTPFAEITPFATEATASSDEEYLTVAEFGVFLTVSFAVSPTVRVVAAAFTDKEGFLTVITVL